MAIIRVPSRKDGIKMKQSLSIAKITASVFKLEIIQDFNGEDTTLGQHLRKELEMARIINAPESLRILKRIQSVEKCGRLNDNGGKGCDCTLYKSKKDFNLKCENCDHVHKEFNSYEDLDKLPCILILVSFVEESMSLVGVFLLNFCRSLFNFLMFVSCFQSSYRSISLVSWGKVFSLF